MKPRLSYLPGNSMLHRLHPLVKVGWLAWGTVFVFIVHSPWWVLGVLALVILAFPLCGLSLVKVRGWRLFIVTASALALLQILFQDQGRVWFEVGPLVVTAAGVEAAVYVAGRFLSVIGLSTLFVLTTAPNDLAYALMQAGLPYRYGFTLITALRLVPIFEREATLVYQAQLARGVQYDRRHWGHLLTLARQFLLPMLVSALSKVDVLAVSMEGRGFGRHPQRTFLREVHSKTGDWVGAGLLLMTIGLTVLWRLGWGE